MKSVFTAIAFYVLTLTVSAQSVPEMLQLADTLYKTNRFLDAVEFYDKISGIDKGNRMARYRLGICYKETLQYEEAKKVLLELGTTPGHEYQARSLYYYSNLLRRDQEFKLADSIYSYLIALPDVNPDLVELSRKQKEGCALALRQQKANRGFSIAEFEDINSKFHDFGAVVNPSNQNVVLATARNRSVAQYEGNQYTGLLPDLVMYQQRRNGRFSSNTNAQNFNDLNSNWGEGSGSFTQDGKSFYFSSCKAQDGSGCQIMVSYLVEGKWTSPEPLNEYVNEPGSENKQPYVTDGGDTLFFSSNRPGGLGGSDIWMSLKGLEAESWTPAINMGSVINSPEEEITPYYSSAANCLIFSSDGHVGYGGYDIYLAKGVSFFEPQIYNLGFPFNSTDDDTYFMISDSVGFISTNRVDPRDLNIYSFDIGDEALFLSLLISGESLIDSRIVSRFRDVRSLDLVTFRVEDYQGFEFFEPVAREKPKPDLVAQADTIQVDSIRSVIGEINKDVIAVVTQQTVPQSSSTVSEIPDNNPARVSPKRVREGTKSSQPKKQIDTSEPIVTSQPRQTKPRLNDVSYSSIDLAFGKRLNRELINFETIYFNYELSDLRSEAEQALTTLVNQLAGRQYQQISILAYSDWHGGASYNLELSKQRGQAVKDFLLSRGIPEGKIKVLPRGEITNPDDHWFKRIMSRKVELIVHPVHPFRLRTAKSYIVRKDNSIRNLAELLGTSEADLKLWNGITSETLGAGNTIRVYEAVNTNLDYVVSEDDLGLFKEGSGS